MDIAPAMLRGMHVAALTSLFGTLLFSAVVLRLPCGAEWPRLVRRRLASLVWTSLLLALVLGVAWFVTRAAAIAGTSTLGGTLAAVPLVGLETRFGRLVLVRILLLLALTPLCLLSPDRSAPIETGAKKTGPMEPGTAGTAPRAGAMARRAVPRRLFAWAAILLAGGALALQAATSHVGAIDGPEGRLLLLAEVLHVLAAGAWLGSLAPLLVCLASMPQPAAARTLRRFFPLGLVAVALIAATSVMQAATLVGSIPALFGTTYGRVALLKLLLFLLLLALATLNRFVFGAAPDLRLRRSIAAESGLAILVLLAAASLANLTPGAHETAVWPFAWRLNPGGWRPLFVPAWPSSFFASPNGFAAGAIVHGERVYQANCASCHGATGQGNGVAATSLPVAPADLTAHRILDYSDGDLFRLAGHEIATSESDRWDLVDYLRANNTGQFVRTSGRGQFSLRTPRFDAVCANGETFDGQELRGKVLRLVVPAGAEQPPPRIDTSVDPTTVSLPADAADHPEEAPCAAQYEAREAFAILLGTTPERLAGNEFLIDANGWLRARWRRPGERGGWPTAALLEARVQAVARTPLPADPAAPHVHGH